MQPTLYAAFNNAADAEKATGALMDHGIKPEQISLIMSEDAQKRAQEDNLDYTHRQIVAPIHSASNTIDPFNNNRMDTPITVEPDNIRDNDLGAGNELRAEPLNPAQNDYPQSGTGGSWSLSSAPPDAKRDYNRGLENDNYNENYQNDVERENNLQYQKDRARAMADEPDEGLDVNRSRTDDSLHGADRTVGPAAYDAEDAAKKGITTTTIEDASSAAKKGAVLGLGVGALAAVAALAIPGFGIVVGGGALAAAAAGLAATAGAGAVAGGVVGYLKDQGVPGHDIPHYQKAVEAGGAVLAVQVDGADRAKIEEVLRKYGAHATNDYGYAA